MPEPKPPPRKDEPPPKPPPPEKDEPLKWQPGRCGGPDVDD